VKPLTIEEWEFRFSEQEEGRRANLERESSFEEIVNEISATGKVLCCHADHCNKAEHRAPVDGKKRPLFWRPVYCIKVTPTLFDRFYNSRYGYRAAYFRSPFEGLAENARLLQALAPALVASKLPDSPTKSELKSVVRPAFVVDPEFIQDSLTSLSAKAWLAEDGKGFCDGCAGEFPSGADYAQIINGRWCGESLSAKYGRAAPCLTKIKVMGAFLTEDRHEFIAEDKRRRHWDIYLTGWS
jgi:hypothetical protein